MAQLTASIVLNYEIETSEGKDYLAWEVDQERIAPEDYQVYLRLYPAVPDRILMSSGNLRKMGETTSQETDYIVFEGTTTSNLNKAFASNVSIEKIGTYLNNSGAGVSPDLVFDAESNSIVSNIKIYGVVGVTYDAPFVSYLYTFAGTPCTTEYVPNVGWQTFGGYTKGTIIAIDFKNDGNDSAHITLTPPSCTTDDFSVHDDDSADEPSMKLEIHKNYPPRLTGSNSEGTSLKSSCRIRVIPDIGAELETSTGLLSLVSTDGPEFEQVIDAVTFSGGNSVNLAYQPNGSVAVNAIGTFYTKWGSTISPNFATAGETVTDVNWINESTYNNPKPRKVRADEVVATTTGGKTIEVFGAIEANYNISFEVYELIFDQADKEVAESGWLTAHVVAFKETYTEHLAVKPPTFKEV